MTTLLDQVDTQTYAGKAAKACQTKFRGIISDGNATSMMLSFFNLMQLNNEFASRGIFITPTNREESYIKIIELGDDDLIAKLEQYIALTEEMFALDTRKQEYVKIIEQLIALPDPNDEAAVNGVVESYLRM